MKDHGVHTMHGGPNQLTLPPVKLFTYGPRSFAVAGPTTWNNLSEYLRDPENFQSTIFGVS